MTLYYLLGENSYPGEFNYCLNDKDSYAGKKLNGKRNKSNAYVTREHLSPLSLFELENEYVAEFDFPGVVKEDLSLDLNVEEHYLQVKAERKAPSLGENVKKLCDEREYGVIEKISSLPKDIDPERVEAKFINGVLRITIGKKKEASKSHKIQIQ